MSVPRYRVDLEACFVLHHRSWRESSLIIDVFGVQSGRLALVARGARRTTSPFRGLLQPFVPLFISWAGRGDLGSLRSAEPDGLPIPLSGRGLAGGLYLNELLMRLTHRHDPHPELLPSYRHALMGLSVENDIGPVLRIFEKRLLAAIGYGLVLEQEAHNGRPLRSDRMYRYLRDAGPVEEEGGEAPGIQVSGATLLALARERFDTIEEASEAKRLMRFLLDGLLGSRPLFSRTLFRTTSGSPSFQRDLDDRTPKGSRG